ncbi:MAG: hypothetical protein KGZ39_05245 [Simkania sp.]|nr:hypothetical protein [Simkania sp.]
MSLLLKKATSSTTQPLSGEPSQAHPSPELSKIDQKIQTLREKIHLRVLPKEIRTQFTEFLQQLQKPINPESEACQKPIAPAIQLLHGTESNEVFRENLLDRLTDVLSGDQGRFDLFWNQIDLYCQLHGRTATLSLDALAELLISDKRLQLLDECAIAHTTKKNLGNATSVKLFFREKLKGELGIPVSKTPPQYKKMAAVSRSDLDTVRDVILSQTTSTENIITILVSSKPWQERIKADPEKGFATMNARFEQEFQEIVGLSLSEAEEFMRLSTLVERQQEEEDAFIRQKTEEWVRIHKLQ